MTDQLIKLPKAQWTFDDNKIYARRDATSEYRWYEVGFHIPGNYRRDSPLGFADDRVSLIHDALLAEQEGIEVAYGPFAIDAEDEPLFVDRWVRLLAKAITGDLRAPTTFPVNWNELF